jgi:hypothetical protein
MRAMSGSLWRRWSQDGSSNARCPIRGSLVLHRTHTQLIVPIVIDDAAAQPGPKF